MKRIICVMLLLSVFISSFAGCSKKEASLIKDRDGEVISNLTDTAIGKAIYEDDGYAAYCDVVADESVGIISEHLGCSASQAAEKLTGDGYTIETFFDKNVFCAMSDAIVENDLSDVESSCVLCDNESRLIAVISGGDDKSYSNNAISEKAPYSSIKPLSVYAPAFEKGTLNWSSLYEDSPLKVLEDENGQLRDWPTNATGTYINAPVTVASAVKISLNTVAVKALLDLGVRDSMNFLRENFDVDLTIEEAICEESGEEEILADIALGYLEKGISPIDMAGCYTMFANGGTYEKPHAVKSITDKDGNVIYEYEYKGKKVLSEENSEIMRDLLMLVTSPGGTAESVAAKGIVCAGKTGTGSDYSGNWFIGSTPSYTCSVWYGRGREKNICPDVFASVFMKAGLDNDKEFPESGNLRQAAYCADSGKLISTECRRVEVGYFRADDIPEKCPGHTAQTSN